MKTTSYQEDGYEMIATPDCYFFALQSHIEVLTDKCFALGDGTDMCVGDKFHKLGSQKTSAGYEMIHMVDGYIEFRGYFMDEDNTPCLCFEVFGSDEEPWEAHWEYDRIFVGFKYLGDGALFFSLPGQAGRVIESNDNMRWTGSNVAPAPKRPKKPRKKYTKKRMAKKHAKTASE